MHTRHPRRRLLLVVAPLVLGVALSACGSTPTLAEVPAADRPAAAYDVVSAARVEPGDPVPRPKGKVVLTLTGVPRTNVGRTLQFDLAGLDALGTVRYSVFDRQAEGRRVSFSGPLLRTVLEVAGADGTVLHGVALNDYAVDVPASDAEEFPVMLATRADGRRMSVAHYGPTRFVYPTSGYRLDKTTYDPRWIWQLARIDVR